MSEREMKHHAEGLAAGGPEHARRVRDVRRAGVSPDMSFLEMLDLVNERLIIDGKEPIAFDHDCREGICGSCGMMINGQAHGRSAAPRRASCTCASTATATTSRSSRGAPRRSR